MGFFSFLFGKKFGYSRNYVSSVTAEKITRDWSEIDTLLKGKSPSQLKQALIIADKSVDNALRDVVAGDSMGERLKNAKDKFEYSQYDKLWKAHKVRNNMVHESGYNPPYYVVTEAIETFRTVLNILGVRL